jgi:hypothetical protein
MHIAQEVSDVTQNLAVSHMDCSPQHPLSPDFTAQEKRGLIEYLKLLPDHKPQ